MLIRVRFFGDLRKNLDKRWMVVEVSQDSTLLEFITNIAKNLDSGLLDKLVVKNAVRSDIRILVNGRNINYLNKLNTKLSDGDIVTIMPMLGEGRTQDKAMEAAHLMRVSYFPDFFWTLSSMNC
jgi:molybdopterin synthase sulfur carrier subunit